VRAEEKALISLFEEGDEVNPRPPDFPGKRKPLNRGLTLLSFQGRRGLGLLPKTPKARRSPSPSGRPPKASSSSGVGQSRRNKMGRPGQGPRPLGRNFSWLESGDLSD